MAGSEMLLYPRCYENHQETDGECRCHRYTQFFTPNSRHRHNSNATRTLTRWHPSLGCTDLVIVLLCVLSVCLRPCDGGVNCSSYSDVNCHHGTCKVRPPPPGKADNNHTVKIDCVCDDQWSGPSCDVFTCKGRTL